MLRRLSVFGGAPSTSKQFSRRSSMPDVRDPLKSTLDLWRQEKPLNTTSPLTIKRNVKFNDKLYSRTPEYEHHVTHDATSDEDDMMTSDNANETDSGSHDNEVFKSEHEVSKEYFVKAFGKRGKQVGEFQDAKHISCLPGNRLLITDYVNSRLQIFSNASSAVTVFSSEETTEPWATALMKDGNFAATMCKDRCVKVFSQNGELIRAFGDEFLMRPTGIAVDKHGNFVVCDSVKNEVYMFDSNGEFIKNIGDPNGDPKGAQRFRNPCYVCVSRTGDIIVSDGGNHMIKIFDSDGHFLRSFGSFGKGDRQFKSPYGVCTNKFGDIFVADHYNSRISLYTRDGMFCRHLVTSEHGLVHPQGLAISSDNHLYVTHGHLKASEILVYKLGCSYDYCPTEIISYV